MGRGTRLPTPYCLGALGASILAPIELDLGAFFASIFFRYFRPCDDHVDWTMAGRIRNVVGLLLLVALAYVSYAMLQVRRRTSHIGRRDFHHSYVRRFTYLDDDSTKDQGLVVSADGAPIDVRSDRCRRRRYVNVEQLTATIVVDLPSTVVNIKQFHSTVNSLLSGAQALVDQVIVVASGLQGPVATQMDQYLSSLGVAGRLIRNAGVGQAASRVAGARLAKSPVVVFADWRVVGTVGWLRPLLGALAVEPNSIVLPHLEDASDPAKFLTTPERFMPEYVWPLSVRMLENASAVTSRGLYRSPALRGDLFAVRRDYWDQLGAYDEALGADSAAANLELALRAWQCGSVGGAGSILVHRCSHIGVRNIHEAVIVVEPNSVKYIAQLWFDDRQNILMRSAGVSTNPEDTVAGGKREGCRSIDAYFNDIAFVPVPSAEAVRFGQLQSATGQLYTCCPMPPLHLYQCIIIIVKMCVKERHSRLIRITRKALIRGHFPIQIRFSSTLPELILPVSFRTFNRRLLPVTWNSDL